MFYGVRFPIIFLMTIEINNKFSYGGETVFIKDNDDLVDKLYSEGVLMNKCSDDSSRFFLLSDISMIKENKLLQYIVDLIESECDYDINESFFNKK